MKKILLAAVMLTAGISAMNAQTQEFNPNAWGANQQSFNSSQTIDGMTVTLEGVENNNLRRVEFANKTPLTLGGENVVVVFKVTYKGATFADFSNGNQVQVRRQLRNRAVDTELTVDDVYDPYFMTQNGKAPGRAKANDKLADAENTSGYYWRVLSGLPNETSGTNTLAAPDWSKEFNLPSSFSKNKEFKIGDNSYWGYSYLAIRMATQAEFTEAPQLTFDYIGVTSPAALANEGEDFMSLSNVAQGNRVKLYVDKMLSTPTGVESVEGDAINIYTEGNTIVAAGAEAIEVYNLSGVKVAAAADQAVVAPGLYIVKADAANGSVVRKVVVK